GHWLLYATGATATYSCQMHGLVQMQGFMMAFAFGFLWTAIPRRTGTEPASMGEIALAASGLGLTTAAAVVERWALAEIAYGALIALLLLFALRRFVAGEAPRRPPAGSSSRASFSSTPAGPARGRSCVPVWWRWGSAWAGARGAAPASRACIGGSSGSPSG